MVNGRMSMNRFLKEKTMNRSLIISVLLSVLVAFAPSTYAQKVSKADARAHKVAARIVDPKGAPVVGATVTAMEGRYVTVSDANGAFNVTSGTADYILVEAPGFDPKPIFVPDMAAMKGVITLHPSEFMNGPADQVNVAFGTQSKKRITGAVADVRMNDFKDLYNDRNYWTLVAATALGTFGATDVRGMGANIVVDGLLRNGSGSVVNFTDMLNFDEIQEVSILKDGASRMLYGTLADKPIIMVKTRRGEAHQRKMNFTYEASAGVPISYPNYLKAADYMILYNEALTNDGKPIKYSWSDIENTRNGVDPVRYPDVDYYRDGQFLKNFKPQQRFGAEFIGGSDVAQYYMNAGYLNSQSLLKEGEGGSQATNRFNVRGAVDVKLNKYVKVLIDGTAIFNAYHGPYWKTANFWNLSTSERVNAYPLRIPIDRINEASRGLLDEAYTQKSVLNGGYLVGGNQLFSATNPQSIYGDLNLGGYEDTMDRLLSVNLGLDVDMRFITRGLSFKSYFGTDNYNKYAVAQSNQYAAYSPTTFHTDGTITLTKLGVNKFSGDQEMRNIAFYRRYGWMNDLNWSRNFCGKHDLQVDLTSLMYTYKVSGAIQADKNINFGVRGNYMYDNRYVVEYSGTYLGSTYLDKGNRWGYAQSVGGAWIVSGENFLRGSDVLNFLKVKASWANTKTDIDAAYANYHMFENTYSTGTAYNYGDGAGQNLPMTMNSGNEGLSFIQRSDLNAGFEAALLKGSLFVEANYFNSLRYDIVERLTTQYPLYLGGGNFIPAENYGRVREQGVEAGVNYHRSMGDWKLGVGLNAVWYASEKLRTNEDDYGPSMKYHQAVGKSSNAVWGLIAEGLYTQQEIDQINASAPGVVRPTFGTVRAGDIRYRDMNGDGRIDPNDTAVIGLSHPESALSLTLNASWRNFSLWSYFEARFGQKSINASSYYQVSGEMKYPAHLTGRWAYDPAAGVDTRATATYPRLTVSEGGNNYRNSTYWLTNRDYLAMPAVQLNYAFSKKISDALRMKKAMVYVRAQNLFTVGPNADQLQLSVGSEPQMRWYYLGIKAEF